MEYRYAPSGVHQTAVPFALKAGVKIDENRGKWRHYHEHRDARKRADHLADDLGTFDLSISSRLTTRTIEHLSV